MKFVVVVVAVDIELAVKERLWKPIVSAGEFEYSFFHHYFEAGEGVFEVVVVVVVVREFLVVAVDCPAEYAKHDYCYFDMAVVAGEID